MTTFLALALCSLSTGHVFLTFFKVFTLTVLFGLYHGLVVFPVVLATLGPQPDQSESPVQHKDREQSREKENSDTNLGFEGTELEIPDTLSTKVS